MTRSLADFLRTQRPQPSLEFICFRMPESHIIPKYAVSVADGLVSNKEQILTQDLIGESDLEGIMITVMNFARLCVSIPLAEWSDMVSRRWGLYL